MFAKLDYFFPYSNVPKREIVCVTNAVKNVAFSLNILALLYVDDYFPVVCIGTYFNFNNRIKYFLTHFYDLLQMFRAMS